MGVYIDLPMPRDTQGPCKGSNQNGQSVWAELCFLGQLFLVSLTRNCMCQLQIGTCQEHCQRLNNKGICHLLPWRFDFPGGSDGKASAYNLGDPGLIPGSGMIPWRRKWQPTPILLPGKSCGRRSLVGYSPWGPKESDTTELLNFSILYC